MTFNSGSTVDKECTKKGLLKASFGDIGEICQKIKSCETKSLFCQYYCGLEYAIVTHGPACLSSTVMLTSASPFVA